MRFSVAGLAAILVIDLIIEPSTCLVDLQRSGVHSAGAARGRTPQLSDFIFELFTNSLTWATTRIDVHTNNKIAIIRLIPSCLVITWQFNVGAMLCIFSQITTIQNQRLSQNETIVHLHN